MDSLRAVGSTENLNCLRIFTPIISKCTHLLINLKNYLEYNYKTKAGNRCDPILFAWRSKKYCHFVQSETYEACPEKDFYIYIYFIFLSR